MGKVRRTLLVLSLAVLALVAWNVAWLNFPLGLRALPLDLVVTEGTTLRALARGLERDGVLTEPWRFELLGRATGKAHQVKAGNYQFTEDLTPVELLHALTGAGARQDAITLIDGWTFRQVRRALDSHPALRHETNQLADGEILPLVGAGPGDPEGRFFPDRYHFVPGASDVSVLRRAYARMQTTLAREWEARSQGLPLRTPYEALVLASIVEKETGRNDDRTLIAGVFVNRLRIGMRLQADPTVIYGLGQEFDGDLRRRHLQEDGPYNTYTRSGLPPTPIALPGLAALRATLNPASTRALYFVARGDGSSHFSETLDEHNRAVNRYQRLTSGR